MTAIKSGFSKEEWKQARAKINESDAFILIITNGAADFFRAKIVSGSKQGTSIYRDVLPSRERVNWRYEEALTDGLHEFEVDNLIQFEYVNASGISFYPSEPPEPFHPGKIIVRVENHADGSFTHSGILLNVHVSAGQEHASVNGTYVFHGF